MLASFCLCRSQKRSRLNHVGGCDRVNGTWQATNGSPIGRHRGRQVACRMYFESVGYGSLLHYSLLAHQRFPATIKDAVEPRDHRSKSPPPRLSPRPSQNRVPGSWNRKCQCTRPFILRSRYTRHRSTRDRPCTSFRSLEPRILRDPVATAPSKCGGCLCVRHWKEGAEGACSWYVVSLTLIRGPMPATCLS